MTKTKNKQSLYIHIPFCTHLCDYCDFTKFFYHAPWIQQYLQILKKELSDLGNKQYFTIYIGGGTPTSLSDLELEALLVMLAPYAKDVQEYTVECNIESTSETKLKLMKQYGVNRLSFGVQSTDDQRLATIGRHHTFQDVVTMIDLAKKLGFHHINVDLIYGLPQQTMRDLANDIKHIIQLDVDHISTYSLTIHPHTKAYLDKWPTLTDEQSRDYYDLILTTLQAHGYERYEVSNFAKQGGESLHNQVYWASLPFDGIGYGASGYVMKNGTHYRYRNIGSFSKYLQGVIEKDEEVLTEAQVELEFLMNNLRLKKGFALSDYQQRFHLDFLHKYRLGVDNLLSLGLVAVTNERICCTDEGLIKLDYVLFKLL